ncbi:hypothetical protein M231_02543 [Tremella mesenterica]|uniref:Uncharacterized protein n=1 Tax=Tremella mesenterica TaxID=5217 RepID=A0A4Q1BQ90_TREME|nr:hypothetical protein M231_02543 [Tremella mesenterica]
MSDPLDVNIILTLLQTLLPRSTSSPFPKPTDAIAALVHTIHIALDFRLIPNPNAGHPLTSDAIAAQNAQPGTEIADGASEITAVESESEPAPVEGQLHPGWNARGEDAYTFEYRHAQSAMTFRVRVGRMGARVQIDATAEDGAPYSLSFVLGSIVTPPAFPIPSTATSSGSSSSSSSPEAPAKSLGFASIASVKDFIDKYKKDVIARILPGLQKDGYSDTTTSGSNPRNPPAQTQPSRDPLPANPSPLLDPLYPNRIPYQPNNPASVGRRDLDPLSSMQPPGMFNPSGDGGGMYVDFNHPLFDGRRRGLDPDLVGPGGLMQPPGARWDPVGPGMGPQGGFPGPGGNPLGGVGLGDPDWGDEMPPPGQFGPDLGRMGGLGGPGMGPGRGRGGGGLGGFGGLGGGRGRGGFGGGFGGGGGMFM